LHHTFYSLIYNHFAYNITYYSLVITKIVYNSRKREGVTELT